MDNKRYYGHDVDLVFVEDCRELGAEELEQVESWADKIQEMSGPHKILLVDIGPKGNRQLEELWEHLEADRTSDPKYLWGPTRKGQSDIMLGPLTDAEFGLYRAYAEQEVPQRVRKGKGQRKANRGSRWS